MEQGTREYKLALELAETLRDRDSLQSYLIYTKTYAEQHLREILAKVMAIEEHKIRKSRGALFTFMLKRKDRYDNSPRH